VNEIHPDPGMALLGAEDLPSLHADLMEVYCDAYADHLGIPAYAPDLYWSHLGSHARSPRFGLVVATLEDDIVGYIAGYPLTPDTTWWDGLTTPMAPEHFVEDGVRTCAIHDLAVRRAAQGRGIGRRLHDLLLATRHEQRATLYVRQGNEPIQSAYRRWGWLTLGQIHRQPDDATYDAMVCPLRGVALGDPRKSGARLG
jgi:ribosomal protein S18 acetylase RimI-like enzyme